MSIHRLNITRKPSSTKKLYSNNVVFLVERLRSRYDEKVNSESHKKAQLYAIIADAIGVSEEEIAERMRR